MKGWLTFLVEELEVEEGELCLTMFGLCSSSDSNSVGCWKVCFEGKS